MKSQYSILLSILFIVLLSGCARQGESEVSEQVATEGVAKNTESSAVADSADSQARDEDLKKSLPPPKITPVTIQVTLSPKADEEIKRSGETILVDVVYGGDPMSNYSKEVNEMGVIELGRVKKELRGAETITLSEDVINKSQLSKTIGQPQILINAISGKKASPQNILACNFYWETLSVAGEGTVTIPCKLLSEVES